MTARENQIGLYIADRWQVNEKLTLNLGLRYENYPLMTRANRGIELLDLTTFNVQPGRPRQQLEGPRHQDQQHAVRAASRPGLPPQRRHGVPDRLWPHVQPAAVGASDSRPVPAGDRLQRRRRERVRSVRLAGERHSRRAESRPVDRQHPAAARRGDAHARSEQRRARHHRLVERVRRAPSADGLLGQRGVCGHRHAQRLHGHQPEHRGQRRQRQPRALRAGGQRQHLPLGRQRQVELQLAAGRAESSVQGRVAAEGRLHLQQGAERGGR